MDDYYSRNYFTPYRYSPFYYRNRSYYRRNASDNRTIHENIDEKKEPPKKEDHVQDSRSLGSSSEPIFELFGIQLYFDDILLISLIFFLYNEGVQDQFLFIALILLLLS